MPSRIEDYALIGDCLSCALVGRNGSIDWLCWPRFDSGACFAALLGRPEHGRWQIAPAGEVRSARRRYRDDTLILDTDFEVDDGAGAVPITWMVLASELQRDWARTATASAFAEVLVEHAGVVGSTFTWEQQLLATVVTQ